MFIFKVMIYLKLVVLKKEFIRSCLTIKNKKKGKKSDHSKNKPTWFIAVKPAT